MKPIAALAALFLLATTACVPRPQPSPPVQTRPTPVATPTPPAPAPVYSSWLDAPTTGGDWSYTAQQLSAGRYSSAVFTSDRNERLFTIMCAGGDNILLRRAIRTVENKTVTVRAEAAQKSFVAPPDPEGQAIVTAVVRPSDSILDAIALSKGRFAVEVAGTPTLYLPSWAEVTRVIEDCR